MIVAIFSGRPLREVLLDPEFAVKIIEKIAEWRTCVGCTNDMDNEGAKISMECQFLGKAHGNITDLELDIIINLYVTQSLEILYPHHVVFCQAYMSQVINAYKDYNAKLLNEIAKRVQDAPPPSQEVSLQKRIEVMQWHIETAHEKIQSVKATILYAPVISTAFSYLYTIGEIIITDEMNAQARDFAIAKMKRTDKEGGESLSALLAKPSVTDHETFKYAYYLIEYFNKKKLKDVIELVNESHFKKNPDAIQ
jgi:hypothetical protein